MIPHHWSRVPANNGAADPNADVRPDRPANSLLGALRGLMATGAAARDDAIGELVASLGGSATNVYSVSSNEGLIDITTGINNVPAAITAPFLLRLAFDTTLLGSATNVPHLMVDNFDCGPILRRDGSALSDGDLVKGVPVLVLGDMAASTDTKVTRVRVLDMTASDQTPSLAALPIGLSISPASAAPDTIITVTAAEVVLADANGNLRRLRGFSQPINTTVAGAGGIDSGAVSNSAAYDLYAAYNPTTAASAAFATLEGQAPTLPAGFTFYRRLGWRPTDSSGRWMKIQQTGDEWRYLVQPAGASNTTSLPVAASGALGGAAYAPLSLVGLVPRRSTRVNLVAMGLALNTNSVIIAPNPNYGLPSANPPVTSHLYASNQDNTIGASNVSQMTCDLEAQADGVPRIWAIVQTNAALLVLGGKLIL